MASTSKHKLRINSYVVLDLETTGLPSNQSRTKITEISILCVYRSHILDTYQTNHGAKFLPRVMNKLTLCINPKKPINRRASVVSGLNDDLLQNCQPFNRDVFKTICSVIKSVEPPVCLLAHNGNKFDYPILQSEIARIGKAFEDDVYCADTLLAFRELVSKNAVISRIATVEELSYDIAFDLDQMIITSDEEDEIPVKNVKKSYKNCNNRSTILNSYKLSDLYNFFTGKKMIDAHQADSDTHALLECVVALGPPLLDWIDVNCIPFYDIDRLW